jgi:hypothetical protein
MSTMTNSSSIPVDPARLHETRAPELVAALAAGPAVAAIFVVMRVYTRFVIVKKRFWEDYYILAALACSIVMSVFVGISKSNSYNSSDAPSLGRYSALDIDLADIFHQKLFSKAPASTSRPCGPRSWLQLRGFDMAFPSVVRSSF